MENMDGTKMSIYQCEHCGVIENTSTGFYHCRNMDIFSEYIPGTQRGMKLCCVCGPRAYKSGNPTKYGKWHNRFEQSYYPLDSIYTDKDGNARFKDTNKYHHEQPERRIQK